MARIKQIVVRKEPASSQGGAITPAISTAFNVHPQKPLPRLQLIHGGKSDSPALVLNALAMGGLKPPAALERSGRASVPGLLAALAAHAILIVAIAYGLAASGGAPAEAESPIEIEVVVEAPALEPLIAIELPPPLPEPVIPVEPEPAVNIELPPELPPPEIHVEVPQPLPLPAPVIAIELLAETPLSVIEHRVPVANAPAVAAAAQRTVTRPVAADARIARQREIDRQNARAEALRKVAAREAGRETSRRANLRQSARPATAPRAASAPSARANDAAAIAAFRAAVEARIARNKPGSSVAANAQGVVTIAFSITASGGASGVRVASSSGHPILDQAALAAIRRAAPFPSPPPGARTHFAVPMRFNAR